MKKKKIKPDVLLFFDGTLDASDAFIKLIAQKSVENEKENIEKGGGFLYNKDVVHLNEAAGLVS